MVDLARYPVTLQGRKSLLESAGDIVTKVFPSHLREWRSLCIQIQGSPLAMYVE